jgi:hypothetical protein
MTNDDKIQSKVIVDLIWNNKLQEAKVNLTNRLVAKVQDFMIGKKQDIAKTIFKGDANEKG